MTRLVIFTSQISPYHNARYVGGAKHFEEIHVISSINVGDFPEFIAKSLGGYSIHRLYDGREAYNTAVASNELVSGVRDLLNCIRPDAIAVAGWSAPESLAALEYGRSHEVPTIVMSESQYDDASRSSLREALKRRVVMQFDAALVGGPPQAHYASRLGIPQERIHFGYNAVDNAYFERMASVARATADDLRCGLGLPARYILASARFISKKNLPCLISAYADARRGRRDLPDLVILGDGPSRAAVEDAIRVNDVCGSVHLPGFRSYDVLPAFYALSEGFLHVSKSEQWGLVINEAMASGVPVVASRPCGAARSLLQDGVNGILTGVDVASISDAIVRLFEMTPKERMDMGRVGASAIRDWGPERFGSGLRAAIESAREAPRRGRIAPWDRAIIGQLQRNVIESVA